MHHSVRRAAFALVALLATANLLWAHGNDPHARVASQNGWRTDLKAAREEARKANKPLLLVLRCFD